MRKLGKFALIGALLALPFSADAFSKTTFDYPQVQTAFNTAVSLENARLLKVPNLSSADRIRLVKAENRLLEALKKLQTAYKTGNATEIKKALATSKTAGNYFSFTLKSLKNEAKKTTTSTTTQTPAQASTLASTPSTTLNSSEVKTGESVSVLYYADSFDGSNTSLWDTFSQWTFSSAKCYTPLSSLVEVSYGGKVVTVKLNDRPNCEKHPDIVDLSKVAFESLAPISKGKLSGTARSLGTVDKEYRKQYLAMDAFSSLGIGLEEKIPNTYHRGEAISISATITDDKTEAVFFLKSPSGKKVSLSATTKNGKVSFMQPLDEVGRYDLVVSSGMGFSTTKTEKIYVLPDAIYSAKSRQANTDSISSLQHINFERKESGDLTGMNILRVSSDSNREYSVTISANGKSVTRSAMGDVPFLLSDFDTLAGATEAKITVQAARSSTPFSLDVYEAPKTIYEGTLPIVSSYMKENKEAGWVKTDSSNVTIYIQTPKDTPIRPDVYLIMPSGKVTTADFADSSIGSDGYLVKGKLVSISIPLTEKGQYIAEIMYNTGFPAFNEPFTFGTDVIATLSNEYDGTSRDTDYNFQNARASALEEINTLRKKVGLNEVSLDVNLDSLAQYKADDMAANNYVGHTDSHGKTIGETAKRAGIDVSGLIGENVAWGTVSADFLIAGLSLSGWHRANILGETWTKLGIGAVEKNGNLYFVEIFGE